MKAVLDYLIKYTDSFTFSLFMDLFLLVNRSHRMKENKVNCGLLEISEREKRNLLLDGLLMIYTH